MKKKLLTLCIVVFYTITTSAQIEINPNKIYVEKINIENYEPYCPFTDDIVDFQLLYSKKKRDEDVRTRSRVKINTDLIDFPSSEAEAAFGYAIDILDDLISSDIDINIGAQYQSTGSGTLASAGPTGLFRLSGGGLPENSIFPIALAEKVLNQELNLPNEYDIVIRISDSADWFYDFNNPDQIGSRFDFVTVILHELFHGLGYISLTDIEDNLGIISYPDGTYIYDQFIEDGEGLSLVQDYENNSFELSSALKGNDLFFSSQFFRVNSPNNLPKLYAPSNFSGASSISHVDQTTYVRTKDALMAPIAARSQIVHDPGISLDMLYDLGWNLTQIFLRHDLFSEDVNEDITFQVEVNADFPFDTSSLKLYFFEGDFNFFSLEDSTLNYNPETGYFETVIPAPEDQKTINYYYSMRNGRNLTTSNPFNSPTNFYSFTWGKDTIKPEITHNPITSINENEKNIFLEARILDQFTGVDTAFVVYTINGEFDTLGLDIGLDEFGVLSYTGNIPIAGIDENSIVEYKLVAIDRSIDQNSSQLPSDGFFNIAIVPLPDPVVVYENTFDAPSEDFVGDGFEIITPDGFTTPAIHSLHPYGDASSRGLSSFSSTYQFRNPIIIDGEYPFVEFDEIVLVEPGELGVAFGETEFWDYVVVEAKGINEETWVPLINGYDSRANADWLELYNTSFSPCPDVSNIPNCISDAFGSEEDFRERVVPLLENESFAIGDTIQLRFRLFSDPAAYGWGWAIDNLKIQVNSTSYENLFADDVVTLYPNPSKDGIVNISINIPEKVYGVITVFDSSGRIFSRDKINQDFFSLRLPESKGVYYLKITSNSKSITKRVVRM